jgi:hypothetical protein
MPPHRSLLLALLLTWAALVPVCLANSEAAPAGHAVEGGELPEEEQRLGAFFLSMLLGIAFLVGYFLQTRHITWFPEAGAFLIIGVIAGAVFHALKKVGDTNVDDLAAYMKFNKEIFFMVLLPPIIFESAYNLRSRKFFANLDAILLLAVYGTLAATIITGVLVKFAGDAGWSHPFDWLPSMLFGSLISATDPVTVLALFSELNADINLYSMVYGESVLNDAVALVMYKTVLTFKETEFNAKSGLAATGTFLKIFISSTLIGVVFALALTMIYRYTKPRRISQPNSTKSLQCSAKRSCSSPSAWPSPSTRINGSGAGLSSQPSSVWQRARSTFILFVSFATSGAKRQTRYPTAFSLCFGCRASEAPSPSLWPSTPAATPFSFRATTAQPSSAPLFSSSFSPSLSSAAPLPKFS